MYKHAIGWKQLQEELKNKQSNDYIPGVQGWKLHPKNNWVENILGTVMFLTFLVFFSHLVGLI